MRTQMRGSALVFLIAFAATAAAAQQDTKHLLSLKSEGLSEGEKLEYAASCLDAGREAMRQDKLGLALDLFDKCLELNSEEVEAHLEKGFLLGDVRIGLRSQAMSELRLYIAANPNSGNAMTELGSLYENSGKIPEALEQFKLAAAREPGNSWAWARYGGLLVNFTDKVQEGIDCLKLAVAKGDDSPWSQISLARGYVRAGNYASARASAAKAIALLRQEPGTEGDIAGVNRLMKSIAKK
jgi:tetratricopeptide (TPR) repeat protein